MKGWEVSESQSDRVEEETVPRNSNGGGENGAQVRYFKEAESAELRNNWLWRQSKGEVFEMIHRFDSGHWVAGGAFL